MPRSIQEILDHADDLAKRFEDYDPSPDDEVAVGEHLLRRAALARARSERQISEAVEVARRAGMSWKRIGTELGITAQAAQQRYGPVSTTRSVKVATFKSRAVSSKKVAGAAKKAMTARRSRQS